MVDMFRIFILLTLIAVGCVVIKLVKVFCFIKKEEMYTSSRDIDCPCKERITSYYPSNVLPSKNALLRLQMMREKVVEDEESESCYCYKSSSNVTWSVFWKKLAL